MDGSILKAVIEGWWSERGAQYVHVIAKQVFEETLASRQKFEHSEMHKMIEQHLGTAPSREYPLGCEFKTLVWDIAVDVAATAVNHEREHANIVSRDAELTTNMKAQVYDYVEARLSKYKEDVREIAAQVFEAGGVNTQALNDAIDKRFIEVLGDAKFHVTAARKPTVEQAMKKAEDLLPDPHATREQMEANSMKVPKAEGVRDTTRRAHDLEADAKDYAKAKAKGVPEYHVYGTGSRFIARSYQGVTNIIAECANHNEAANVVHLLNDASVARKDINLEVAHETIKRQQLKLAKQAVAIARLEAENKDIRNRRNILFEALRQVLGAAVFARKGME